MQMTKIDGSTLDVVDPSGKPQSRMAPVIFSPSLYASVARIQTISDHYPSVYWQSPASTRYHDRSCIETGQLPSLSQIPRRS
jgi:hypothetical protein